MIISPEGFGMVKPVVQPGTFTSSAARALIFFAAILVFAAILFWADGFCAPSRAADPTAGAAAPADPSANPPATQPVVAIPRDLLSRMYARELGTKFKPADFDSLYAAHLLIEQYFLAGDYKERARIAKSIEATGIDANILGRLTRLRLSWPALTPGTYYINDKAGPNDVRYFLGIPAKYDRSIAWPLVVKLPSANAFLTDPPPSANQVIKIYTQWMTDELTAHPDAIVLMPLLNLDQLYGPGPIGMNLVMQPIFHAAGKVNIDPARVYLTGHAMAANGVWNLGLHYPTYFAAINPMAGSAKDSWQRTRIGNLSNVLSVVWADPADQVVKPDESRELVKLLHNLNCDVDYTETSGLGHAPSAQIIAERYAKLRSRTRELYPADVFVQSDRPDTIFNRVDWVQIYQPLVTGQEIELEFSRGGENIHVYQKGFRAVAEFKPGNAIVVNTINVESLRIYLNDQMVDLTKPVTITVNGKVRYQQIPEQSVAEMLKDQLFLNRGWRYFPVAIDFDLTDPATQPGTGQPGSATQPSTQPAHHGTIIVTTPDGETKVYEPKSQQGDSPPDGSQ
jgi:hypothetical protein